MYHRTRALLDPSCSSCILKRLGIILETEMMSSYVELLIRLTPVRGSILCMYSVPGKVYCVYGPTDVIVSC